MVDLFVPIRDLLVDPVGYPSWPEAKQEKSGEDLTWDATGADPTWQIKMGYEKEELCMAASGWKNGSPVVAATR